MEDTKNDKQSSNFTSLTTRFNKLRRSDRFRNSRARLRFKEKPSLTLEVLLALTPIKEDETDIVREMSRNKLIGCVKSQEVINTVFFPQFEPIELPKEVDLVNFPLETLSCAFVCSAIGKLRDSYGFHETIHMQAVEETLWDIYTSVNWKKLGFQLYTSLYPDIVTDGQTGLNFRDFMESSDRVRWAEQIISSLKDPGWTKSVQKRIIQCQLTDESYNKEVNSLLLKIHLLDPKSVITAFQFLCNQRALPAVNLELATRNYLGDPLDIADIQHEVEVAKGKHSSPVHVNKLTLNYDIDVYYGVQVDEYVITEGRNHGFWSGRRPDNGLFPWSVYWSSYETYAFTGRDT